MRYLTSPVSSKEREAGRDLSPALGKASGSLAESDRLTVEKRKERC